MDYQTKLVRRKEYHERKYAVQKVERDKIRAFAAEHPERFKELVARIRTEQEAATILQPVTGTHVDTSRIEQLIREIHKGKRDWHITAKDAYGDEHTLFLGFPISHTPQPGDKIKTPIKGTEYTVIDATPCTCPLCT